MKYIALVFVLFVSQVLFSQNSDWVKVNPNPQNDFYAIKFFNQNTGYVVGSGGIILKNTTGSKNWITIPSGTVNDLYSLYFFDVNHGYIVGAGGLIMNTSDGGNNWTHLVTSSGYALRGVTFINPNTGFIIGDHGEFYRTSTGIYGWIQATLTTKNLRSVFFADSLNGYACGDSGIFFKTTNSGLNWSMQYVGSNYLTGMYFTTAQTGYLMANLSGSLKTTDGGSTWSTFNFGYSSVSHSIKFVNQNIGFAVGQDGPIMRTMNAGVNWSTWCSDQLFPGNTFLDIYPVDSNNTYTCGTRGWILKSIDSGNNYQHSYHLGGSRFPLTSISFINENTGEVVGNNQYLYTTNGGVSWSINLVGSDSWFEGSGSITGARLFPPNSGYRTQYYGGMGFNVNSIENSTDGGLTWGSGRGYSVMNGFAFPGVCEAEGVTYLVSSINTVLKNTGSGWTNVLTATSYNLGQVDFINANTGAVIGGGTVHGITRTTNGGANWSFVPFGNTHRGYNLNMLSSGVGYVAGDSGFVMKTYDYGANWTLLSSNGNLYISKIYFASDNTGWYLGQTGNYPNYNGRLYYTPNGGTNFVQLQSLMNFNVSGFSFVNAYTGYVCGDSGVVLKTTNGGLTFVNPSLTNLPETYSLSQNYPNPFNPVTKINFAIPGVGNGRDRSVKLIIYDVLGREVATLVNQQLQPGTYSVDWDGTNYPSGVYFYQLSINNEQLAIKKMVLIK